MLVLLWWVLHPCADATRTTYTLTAAEAEVPGDLGKWLVTQGPFGGICLVLLWMLYKQWTRSNTQQDAHEAEIRRINAEHDTEIRRLNADHDAEVRRLNQVALDLNGVVRSDYVGAMSKTSEAVMKLNEVVMHMQAQSNARRER